MSEVLTEDGLDPALIISTVGEEQIVEGGQEIIIYPKSVAAQQQTEKEQEVSVIFPKSRAYYSKMSLVDLGKRLLDAAKRGETDEVRTLMSNGAPFTTDWLGTSPLHFASQYGHLETAEVLLRAGISRDARTKVDRTPLHVAAQEGHSEIVDLLVQHAADIEAKDMLKMTPLHWATEKGHSHVMENLIKHGADITCENKFDRTPLDIATANGRADLVQILQIASHTQIGNMTEGDTVTIETSEVEADGIETVTVTTTDTRSSDSEMKGGVIPVSVYPNFSNKDDKSTDQSNSSVLATLAALAEATAPNTSTQAVTGTSNTDAMSWLESQGITMITTTDGGMISSAVENGQSITLTEAGKIALTNIIKQQALQTEDESVVSHDPEVEEDLGTVPDDSESQKVITIVAEPQDPSDTDGTVIETITPESIVMGAGDASDSIDVNDEPPTKRQRTEDSEQAEDKDESLDGMDKEALRKQLEEIQKQAETYKLQLKQKEQEAEEYKKKLNESIGGSSETDEPAIE